MPVAYTPRTKGHALAFPVIDAFYAENGRVPSCRELAAMFHWSSYNRAAVLYRSMVRYGLLRRLELPGRFQPLLVPVGRRVSNKRLAACGRKPKPPQVKKRKPQQNQQDTKP